MVLPETVAVWNLLALGVVLGMRHALEADHLAAVAALVTRSRTVRQTALQGVAWGTGHALTLVLFGGVALALSREVPTRAADALELAVGIMLVLLGIDVLRRLLRERIHFHVHHHRDGAVHWHAHTHALGRHKSLLHEHAHFATGFPFRALFVGMMHGMAGSAALIVLAATAAPSLSLGVMYIAFFGFGSMLGMGALSTVIAVPMQRAARLATWSYRVVQAVVGAATLILGAVTVISKA